MSEGHSGNDNRGEAEADAFKHGTLKNPVADTSVSIWSIPKRSQSVFAWVFVAFLCYSSYKVYIVTPFPSSNHLSFLDSIIKVGNSSIISAFAIVVVVELFRICFLKVKQEIEEKRQQREKDIISKHYRQIGQKNPLTAGDK